MRRTFLQLGQRIDFVDSSDIGAGSETGASALAEAGALETSLESPGRSDSSDVSGWMATSTAAAGGAAASSVEDESVDAAESVVGSS
jgi:hypothetical protein